MRERRLLAAGARIYGTHIAQHRSPAHDGLVALTTPHGYDVAWDGLTVGV